MLPLTPYGRTFVLGRRLTGVGGLRLTNAETNLDVTQMVKRWVLYQRHYGGLTHNQAAPASWQQLLVRCIDCEATGRGAFGSPTMKNLVIEIYLRRNYQTRNERHRRSYVNSSKRFDLSNAQRRYRRSAQIMNGECSKFFMGLCAAMLHSKISIKI